MRSLLTKSLIGLAALALLAGGAGVARADTVFVSVESNFFDQAEITINQGDTVVWVWVASAAHTTTSIDGLWDSGIQSQMGFMFQYTFNNPGDFVYICTLHFGCCNMAGVVHVNAVCPPPCCPPPCCPPPCCPPPCCPPPCCPPPCCPPACCPPVLLTTAVLSAAIASVVGD
jgi:plastocyanin